MGETADVAALDAALLAREAWLERAGRRWLGLAHVAALAFVAVLYSNPMYWWPWFEKLRLGFVTMGVGAAAVLVHRLVSGERIRTGGWGSLLLFAYLSFIPLSLAWTLNRDETLKAIVEGSKMAVVFVAVQNAILGPARLRRFLLVAAVVSLGPALGGFHVWRTGDALVDGFRTHWRGMYGDPNRLAMSLIAVLPFALYGVFTARRLATRLLFGFVVAAQLTAIVLTHSRSGAVATALAVALFLFREQLAPRKKVLAALAITVGLVALAPSTFWERNRTITDYQTDVSVEGREHAWMVLGVIFEERPLSGVGAGAFLTAWSRYAPMEAGGRRYVAHNILLEIVGDLGVIAFALFCGWLAWVVWNLWLAGRDPLVGREARAVFASLVGYGVIEMANGYTLSWFLYFLFACAAACIQLARARRALEAEAAR